MRLVVARDVYIAGVTGLIEAASWWPRPGLLKALSAAAGALAYRVSRGKRHKILRNLGYVFPDRPSVELRSVARAVFQNFWIDVFHLAYYRHPEWVPSIPIAGEDHLRQALNERTGVLLWESNSFGFRNLAKLALARRGYRFVQVHLDSHLGALGSAGLEGSRVQERFLRPCFEQFSRPWAIRFIYLGKDGSLAPVRRLMTVLSRGEPVVSTMDGNWGHGSVGLPFLGTELRFRSGALSAARLTGATVLPLWCFRTSEGFRVLILPPVRPDLEERQGGAEIRQLVARLEELVFTHPEQFYRWHTLPFPADAAPETAEPAGPPAAHAPRAR
ncbi:MAG: hypothetical protein Kow00109_20420 [Acidobacteriota bacterium]